MVEGKGWYGRVRDDRGHWSFGPTSLSRALAAVEARLNHAPFEPQDDERAWHGDAMTVVAGAPLRRRQLPASHPSPEPELADSEP
jgi:hypothetical protein